MTQEDEADAAHLLTNSRKCFTCPVLHARMRKIHCVERQNRQPTLSNGGRIRIMLYNEPADHYCRSGECETGNKISKQKRIT